jgi:CRP-like cAMP-binding protein
MVGFYRANLYIMQHSKTQKEVYNFFAELHPFSEFVLTKLSLHASIERFKREDSIIREEIFNPSVYTIKKGLVRSYFIDPASGLEITKTFRTESGYFMQCEEPELKSSYQAVEDCELYVLHLDVATDLRNSQPSFQEFLYRSVSEDWRHKELLNKILSLPSASARYKMFISSFQSWAQRIPQYHIASLLNMTPIHLSRIRKVK